MEKNVPEIRFKGFEGEWKRFSLGELGSVATNKRIFIHQTSLIGDVPFYKIGTFGREPKLFISQELFEDYKKRYPFPEKGDLLFSVIGSIGRVVEYTGEDEYFQDSNVVWLKHDGAIVNSFLKQFYSIVEWEGIEGSTIKHLYNRTILGTKIQTPSREEQTKIGNTFQKLDSLINQHQQKHDKLSSIKKAMLERMFPKQGETIPEIRFKGFNREWEEKVLGRIASFYKGKDLPKSSIHNDGLYPCIHYGELFTKYSEVIEVVASKTNQNDSFFSISNDVLMPTSDVTPKGLVKSCCVKQNGVVLGGDILVIRPNGQNIIDGAFLSRFIRTREQLVLQSVTGSTVFHLYASSIESLDIVFPSIEEQIAIGNYFQKLDALINQHQQQITKLNNVKQACLSKMFV